MIEPATGRLVRVDAAPGWAGIAMRWSIPALPTPTNVRVHLEGELRGREFGANDQVRAFRRFVLGVLEEQLAPGADILPVRVVLARLSSKVEVLAGLFGPMDTIELGVILTEAERLLLANVKSREDPLAVAVERTLTEVLARVRSMAKRRKMFLDGSAQFVSHSLTRGRRGRWSDVIIVGGRVAA